jgi:hypothetical protein
MLWYSKKTATGESTTGVVDDLNAFISPPMMKDMGINALLDVHVDTFRMLCSNCNSEETNDLGLFELISYFTTLFFSLASLMASALPKVVKTTFAKP